MLEPFLPAANSQIHGDPLAASRLLSEWEAEGRPRSTATDLVRLQTLVMVAIATDYQGIAMAKGQVGGPSKAEILGRAVGLGYSMRLHLGELDPVASPELDPNSDDNVALRVWWVLVMLDRWHAVGAATPTLISNDNVVVLPGLKHILGDVVFTLIRKLSRRCSCFSISPRLTKQNQASRTPSDSSSRSRSNPHSTFSRLADR